MDSAELELLVDSGLEVQVKVETEVQVFGALLGNPTSPASLVSPVGLPSGWGKKENWAGLKFAGSDGVLLRCAA
jgi:hypothetical protein